MTAISTLVLQLVYLVIPTELCDTGRAKLGRSNKNTYDRIRTYGKDAKLLGIMSVENSIFVEKRLKDRFKTKFKSFKKEYFEGDINEMRTEFLDVVYQCYRDTPTDEENAYITKILEEEQEIIMREQKMDDLKKKREKEIAIKKKKLVELKNKNKKKEQEKRDARLKKKIQDEECKLSRIDYTVSREHQDIIMKNTERYPHYRTSKQEFTDFLTLNKMNVSTNDFIKFMTSIPGITYDRNTTKKVKDRSDRGVFRGVLLKNI
tara:strand:+ start:1396 stop:2181 length:786 start_codon:yes stop_codon:yes gene_type:complete